MLARLIHEHLLNFLEIPISRSKEYIPYPEIGCPNKIIDMNKFYTVDECAELFRISKSKLWKMIRGNEIKIMRVGHRIIITQSAIEEYQEKNEAYYSEL